MKVYSESTVELIGSTKLEKKSTELCLYPGNRHEVHTYADPDTLPVLAARVSHGQDDKTGEDPEKDLKLMKYLAEHKHMTPFEHQFATFMVHTPIFVAREFMRHRTLSYNEISARYTDDMVGEVFIPKKFRKQASRNKQSSSGAIDDQEGAEVVLSVAYSETERVYKLLNEQYGVAREHARSIMPVGNMTRFYVSGNLRNWAHFCGLRQAEDAQEEIREVANKISDILYQLYPNSWGVLHVTTQTSNH